MTTFQQVMLSCNDPDPLFWKNIHKGLKISLPFNFCQVLLTELKNTGIYCTFPALCVTVNVNQQLLSCCCFYRVT